MSSILTSALVVSGTDAYLAYSDERRTLGPNGEPRIARILHTTDTGVTWHELPWVRTLLSRIRHPGYPTWPPEAVMRMVIRDSALVITHRDEWVPYEPGGESLWESTFLANEWKTARIRVLDYDGEDGSALLDAAPPTLPPEFRLPAPR